MSRSKFRGWGTLSEIHYIDSVVERDGSETEGGVMIDAKAILKNWLYYHGKRNWHIGFREEVVRKHIEMLLADIAGKDNSTQPTSTTTK